MKDEFWTNKLRGKSWNTLSESEKKEVTQWTQNDVFMAEAFVDFLAFRNGQNESYHEAEKALDWKKLESKLEAPAQAPTFWNRSIPLYQALAAAAVLAIAVFIATGIERKSDIAPLLADTTSSVSVGEWNEFQKAFVIPLP